MRTTEPATTTDLTINGCTRPIHYTMFTNSSIRELSTALESHLHDYDSLTITQNNSVELTTNTTSRKPRLSAILLELTTCSFTANYIEPSQFNIPSPKPDFIPSTYNPWQNSAYEAANPTLTDVIATYICLLNATTAHNSVANNATTLTDQTYHSLIGIATAMRDAHFKTPTTSPFTPAQYSTPEIRFHNLLTQSFDIQISDNEIHALRLYQTPTENNLYANDLGTQNPLFNSELRDKFFFTDKQFE